MSTRARMSIKSSTFDSSQVWLITFSDLLFLLLAFFVFQVSMSTFEKPKETVKVSAAVKAEQQKQNAIRKLAKDLEANTISAQAQNLETTTPIQQDIRIKATKDGVLIALGGGRFASGSRELSLNTKSVIAGFVDQLRDKRVNVRIEGHTDSQSIHSTEFPSNWELSTARAISVALAFTEFAFPGKHISAVGYADTKPIADNGTEEGRELNRRVEILISPMN